MKKVLFVRHGQSETNLRGVFAGGGDNTPLTDFGRQQAKQAGQDLKHQKIDRIIASPLDRTQETARIIACEIGFDISKIQSEPLIGEYDIGSGNGEKIEGMTSARLVSFEGAENPNKFAERVEKALRHIQSLDGTTLIVAHGGVGRMIKCIQSGDDPAGFFDTPGYANGHAFELNLDWLEKKQ